jgi:hypothetical protein
MTKEQYKRARRMIRDNGRSAYAWIAQQMGGDWTVANKLRDLADAQDWMAERADIVGWCKRAGVAVNARQTSRGYCAGVAA